MDNMINRDNKVSIEAKRLWLRIAKRMKIVHVLYKFDNVLKNTDWYEKDGIIKSISFSSFDDIDNIANILLKVKMRFIDNSLKETIHMNYWKNEIQ